MSLLSGDVTSSSILFVSAFKEDIDMLLFIYVRSFHLCSSGLCYPVYVLLFMFVLLLYIIEIIYTMKRKCET